jgi:hypothetical protein
VEKDKFYWRNWRGSTALAEVIAHGKDRFAAVAEFPQRFTDILHGRLVGPGKIFQIHHNAGDVAIIFCLANSIHDIEQEFSCRRSELAPNS